MAELEPASVADTTQPQPLATNSPSVAPVQRQSVPPPPTRQPPPTGPLPPLPLPPGARPPAKPSMDVIRMDFAPSQGEGETWAPPLNAPWTPQAPPEAPPKSRSPALAAAQREREKRFRPPPEARSAQQKNMMDLNAPAPTSLFKRLSRSLGSTRSTPALRTNPASRASQSSSPDPNPDTTELGALEPVATDVKRGLTNLVPRARASITARNAAAAAQRTAASDARRAEALRATGLLPASRRYSVAVHQDSDVNKNINDEGALAGRLERRRSRQGVCVPEPKQRSSEDGESEGDESAAARIARAWKTRYETSSVGTGAGSGETDTTLTAPAEEKECPESVVSVGAVPRPLVSDAPQEIARSIPPPSISPDAAAALAQRAALATWSFPGTSEKGSHSSSVENLSNKEADFEGKHQTQDMDADVGMRKLQEPARDQGPDLHEHGDEKAKSALGLGLHVPSPPPPPPKDSTSPVSPRNVALPASPSSPSSSPVPGTSLPNSPSGSQRLVRSPPLSARASPAPLTVCTALGIRASAPTSTTFLSTSPTSLTPTPTPTPHSLTPTPTPKPTTPIITNATSSLISSSDSQESSSSSIPSSEPIPIPAPVPSSALQYPLTPVPLLSLSPTTSSTSTCLPATPSDGDASSCDGHSEGHGMRSGHIRVLSVPLEADEDAFLSEADSAERHDDQGMNTVSGRKDKDRTRTADAQEFGALVQRTDGEEESETGCLPPLPASITSRDTTLVTVTGKPVVKRKTLNLFGRRRNTDPISTITPPPTIEIPDRTKTDNAPLQTKRSLTTLRRAVAAVSGNAQPSYTAKDETHRHSSQPQSLHHSATMPVAAHRSGSGWTSNRNGGKRGGLTDSSTSSNLAPPFASHTRPRAPALSPTMHSRASILMETGAIEDEESRRLSEAAFLDF